jgi:hypothetical protein
MLAACKKDAPVHSPVPAISFVSIYPSSVKEYKEHLVFTISYEDGDGDLGENNPDVTNLFLIDNRINVAYLFRIPQLSPASVIIKGQLDIVLKNTGITNGSNQQTATYSIYVKDRAGNKSNEIISTPVTINK